MERRVSRRRRVRPRSRASNRPSIPRPSGSARSPGGPGLYRGWTRGGGEAGKPRIAPARWKCNPREVRRGNHGRRGAHERPGSGSARGLAPRPKGGSRLAGPALLSCVPPISWLARSGARCSHSSLGPPTSRNSAASGRGPAFRRKPSPLQTRQVPRNPSQPATSALTSWQAETKPSGRYSETRAGHERANPLSGGNPRRRRGGRE